MSNRPAVMTMTRPMTRGRPLGEPAKQTDRQRPCRPPLSPSVVGTYVGTNADGWREYVTIVREGAWVKVITTCAGRPDGATKLDVVDGDGTPSEQTIDREDLDGCANRLIRRGYTKLDRPYDVFRVKVGRNGRPCDRDYLEAVAPGHSPVWVADQALARLPKRARRDVVIQVWRGPSSAESASVVLRPGPGME